MKPLARVAIVGRPNVGKSTLFNRITGERRAIVHREPGVTRDVQRAETEWSGVPFEVIDTGGLFSAVEDGLTREVEGRAMKEALGANVVVFVTDAATGITPADIEVAGRLRPAGAPVLVAVNKMDRADSRFGGADFYQLGFSRIHEISAMHGDGVGDLLDDVVALIPRRPTAAEPRALKIAVVGRPNVGKSSLVNRLVGKATNIVDSAPGTTRDSIDIALRWRGRRITLVDTAGIKRRSKTKSGVMTLTTLKSIDSIERADIVVLMLDASEEISNQDVKVASYAHKAAKGLVICVNKWDLVEKDNATTVVFERKIRKAFAFAAYAPILFISALTGQRVSRIFPLAWDILEAREKRLSTSELNAFIENTTEKNPAPSHKGGTGRIYYATQVDISPPTFALFVNKRAYFGRAYLRFLNNRLRERFPFDGTLIRIKLVEKKRRRAPR